MHWAEANPHSPPSFTHPAGAQRDPLTSFCVATVTSDPTFTAAVLSSFMPPSCHYLQYLLLLISLLLVVNIHAHRLSERNNIKGSSPPHSRTKSKHHLRWKQISTRPNHRDVLIKTNRHKCILNYLNIYRCWS